MRPWQIWWQTLVLATQYNPAQFIELVMLTLSIFLLMGWGVTQSWPYFVLSLSYIIGSSTSILIREACTLPRRLGFTPVTAIVLLMISLYSLADLLL